MENGFVIDTPRRKVKYDCPESSIRKIIRKKKEIISAS